MLALARYTLKSPFHAATMVSLLAVLSLFIPLVSILSGAVVGLIILTQGMVAGTRALLISLAGITVVSYLVTKSPVLGISIGLVQWIPMVLLAEVLRRSRSFSFTLLIGMMAAIVVVLVQYALWPDMDQLWSEILQQMFTDVEQPGIDSSRLDQAIAQLVHLMTLVLVAVMYSTFIATLMLSRWLQARLAESAGFRSEFYALKLGKAAALAALALAALSVIIGQDWLFSALMVVLVTFLYQGLAVVHRWSYTRRQKGWLVLLYILMVIFPQVLAATALLGIIDNWADFRSSSDIS